MRFAVVLPWWGHALVFGGAAALAWLAYARVATAIPGRSRAWLTGLRAATLALVVAMLLRPVVQVPRADGPHSLVPVLVDVSRSMRLVDADGRSRLARAQEIVRALQSGLGSGYRLELLTFGDALATGDVERLAATARQSDLGGALADLADRHRHDRMAAVIVLSDGGDTAPEERPPGARLGAPVLTVGLGAKVGVRDREVLNVTAGEPLLAGASIDLSVSAVSEGLGRGPMELRVSANGRPVQSRRVVPSADGAPVHEVFTVSPPPDAATVYTVEIPAAADELAPENNRRSVLVPAHSGRRRVLVVEGAPGHDHVFLRRALATDPGLEVDTVVRKGKNSDGRDTFYVQAGRARAAALSAGYPTRRSELFAYDAIIFGNVASEFFTRDQLELTRRFVADRGGGLLVVGARSFDRLGLSGTSLDDVLPIDPAAGREFVARASEVDGAIAINTAVLTADGALHPATRLAASAAENRRRWARLPALAVVTMVGGPRPGAQVLAVSAGPDGDQRPLIVAQRYGQGRAIVFAGEASWRWRMQMPASDTSYETIWRQIVRWTTAGAQPPVTIAPLAPGAAGVTERLVIAVRNEDFEQVRDAEVRVVLTGPDGRSRAIGPALTSSQDGRYRVAARFGEPGVYRVDVTAERAGARLGSATRQVLVGGADPEMSQPRLNEAVLRRLADATGGGYVPADRADTLAALVRQVPSTPADLEVRDLWHTGWSLLAIIGLLATEWIMRRRVGLA